MKRICITIEVHKLKWERKRKIKESVQKKKECNWLQHNLLASKVKAASVFIGSVYLGAFAVPWPETNKLLWQCFLIFMSFLG